MKKLWRVLVILAVLVLVFLLVSFRLMKSQMNSSSQVASARSGPQSGEWVRPSQTGLYVEGSSSLERAVQANLLRLAKDRGDFGQPTALSSGTGQGDAPLLWVDVKEQRIFWTPFFARSTLQVLAAYGSNGDVSFRDDDPVQFNFPTDRPYVLYRGKYEATDVSWGFISLPGYNDYLAERIAEMILATQKDQMLAAEQAQPSE